jgi:hypothetical protein
MVNNGEIAGFRGLKCLETLAKQAFQRISLFTRAGFFLILENDRPTETILH